MLAVLGGLADVEHDLNPHPHRRRQEPRQGPRKAHGRPPTKERGHQAARAGRDIAGIGAQLQRQPSDDFTADGVTEFFM
jgi:hypothetical protein